jgi:hypothetical protein
MKLTEQQKGLRTNIEVISLQLCYSQFKPIFIQYVVYEKS